MNQDGGKMGAHRERAPHYVLRISFETGPVRSAIGLTEAADPSGDRRLVDHGQQARVQVADDTFAGRVRFGAGCGVRRRGQGTKRDDHDADPGNQTFHRYLAVSGRAPTAR